MCSVVCHFASRRSTKINGSVCDELAKLLFEQVPGTFSLKNFIINFAIDYICNTHEGVSCYLDTGFWS